MKITLTCIKVGQVMMKVVLNEHGGHNIPREYAEQIFTIAQ